MIQKYLRLADDLETMIESKGHNQLIPSKRSLAKVHGLSRMTVRKAIDHLIKKNKLYRIPNKGTYTMDEKLFKDMDTFIGFTREVRNAGGIPSTELIEYNMRPAGEFVAGKLDIRSQDYVYKVIRLRKKNDVPLREDITKRSIYAFIKNELKLNMVRTHQKLKATFASYAYQKLLEIEETFPVIHLELTGFLDDGRTFEYTNSYKNSERYELVIISNLQ
jgi:DNA-binding GntR family transcriptional regulator